MDQLLDAEARGILVEDGLQTYEQFTQKLAIEALDARPCSSSPDGFRKSRLQLALRRLVSLVVAAVGLVLTRPAHGLIALAIKLDSRGPGLLRPGAGGPARPAVQAAQVPHHARRPTEPATSEWVRDNERPDHPRRPLAAHVPARRAPAVREHPARRHEPGRAPAAPGRRTFELFDRRRSPTTPCAPSVRPGVTGWAQVRYGYANNLEEEIEKMRYDLYYIKHMSLWLDLRILARHRQDRALRPRVTGRRRLSPEIPEEGPREAPRRRRPQPAWR